MSDGAVSLFAEGRLEFYLRNDYGCAEPSVHIRAVAPGQAVIHVRGADRLSAWGRCDFEARARYIVLAVGIRYDFIYEDDYE